MLARIPEESRGRDRERVAPHQLSPAGVEAYRTLRATLTAPRGEGGRTRSVMITGAFPSEGKTTTALNLAASFALAGKRVILIEADLRRPKIGSALGVRATRGIASVLIDGLPLNEALLTTEAYGENLQLLLVDRAGEWMADQFSLPAAQGLVEEAKEMADCVIIDSPPLTEVIDALPLVQMTDDVVIVVRLGPHPDQQAPAPRRAARPVPHQARRLRAGRRQPDQRVRLLPPSARCGCRKRPGPPRSRASRQPMASLRGLPAGVMRAGTLGPPMAAASPSCPDRAWYLILFGARCR